MSPTQRKGKAVAAARAEFSPAFALKALRWPHLTPEIAIEDKLRIVPL